MGLFVLERCYLCDTHTSGKLYYTNNADDYVNDKATWNKLKNSKYYVCDVLENPITENETNYTIKGRIIRKRFVPFGVYTVNTSTNTRYDTVSNPSVDSDCGWTVGINNLNGTPVIVGNKNFESAFWHYGKSNASNECGFILGTIKDFSKNHISLDSCAKAIGRIKKILVENKYKEGNIKVYIDYTTTNLIDNRNDNSKSSNSIYDFTKNSIRNLITLNKESVLSPIDFSKEVAMSYETLSSTKFVIKKEQ